MLLRRERAFDGSYVVVAGLGLVDIRLNDSHPYPVVRPKSDTRSHLIDSGHQSQHEAARCAQLQTVRWYLMLGIASHNTPRR